MEIAIPVDEDLEDSLDGLTLYGFWANLPGEWKIEVNEATDYTVIVYGGIYMETDNPHEPMEEHLHIEIQNNHEEDENGDPPIYIFNGQEGSWITAGEPSDAAEVEAIAAEVLEKVKAVRSVLDKKVLELEAEE